MDSPPTWITALSNQLVSEMMPVDLLSPVGCHYFHEPLTDLWEITLFASATEIVGGEFDGDTQSSKFTFNIIAASSILDEVTGVNWQNLSIAPDDELGPHLSIEGKYRGYSVWIRILAMAPAQFEHGRRLSVYEMKIEDLW